MIFQDVERVPTAMSWTEDAFGEERVVALVFSYILFIRCREEVGLYSGHEIIDLLLGEGIHLVQELDALAIAQVPFLYEGASNTGQHIGAPIFLGLFKLCRERCLVTGFSCGLGDDRRNNRLGASLRRKRRAAARGRMSRTGLN